MQRTADHEPDAKKYLTGTHRTVCPRETIARLQPFLERMGITRTANVTGLDRIGIPVVTVCRPNARSLAVSQGKGIDLDAATASGLMEAAELYHAEHIELPLKLGSMAELEHAHAFADIDRLPRVAGGRFHRDLVTLWIEGRDLFTNDARWVPYECVRANFTLPAPPGSGCFDCSSNGLASGNTTMEAICHAICEIVERDATALWNCLSAGERASTAVDLGSVSDEACLGVLASLERAEFSVAVWQTTSDVGVASFFCLIGDRLHLSSHHGVGAGTHPAPNIALLRALTEAVQVRTTYISGARDDLLFEEFSERYRASRRQVATRLRAGQAPSVDFGSIEDHSGPSFADDLAWLLSRLQCAGMNEAIAVDLSKSGIGIPVVRVVVPGLEGPDDHDAYLPGARARQRLGRIV